MRIDQWPHDVHTIDTDKGRTNFKYVDATVDRVFEQYGYGLSFVEDTTNTAKGKPIWNLRIWNEATRKMEEPDASFRVYNPGSRVRVQLSTSESNGKTYYNIGRIEHAKATEVASSMGTPPTAAPTPVTGGLTTAEQIAKNSALNNMTEVLVHTEGDHLIALVKSAGYEGVKQAVEDWGRSWQSLRSGKPAYSDESPLVQEAIDRGGVVIDEETGEEVEELKFD